MRRYQGSNRQCRAGQPDGIAGEDQTRDSRRLLCRRTFGEELRFRRCCRAKERRDDRGWNRQDSSVLAELEAKGAVKMAGAMYNLETGAVEFFD